MSALHVLCEAFILSAAIFAVWAILYTIAERLDG